MGLYVKLAWSLVSLLGTDLQQHGNIGAKPKVCLAVFILLFFSPKIGMDWWQPRDVALGNMRVSIISEDANTVLN